MMNLNHCVSGPYVVDAVGTLMNLDPVSLCINIVVRHAQCLCEMDECV